MAEPRHHRTAPGESGAERRAAVSLLRLARRPRAANDNRLALRKWLQRLLPLLAVAALLTAGLLVMAR